MLVASADFVIRNELVLEFDGFIETARIASYDLQKFNSHVGRVRHILLLFVIRIKFGCLDQALGTKLSRLSTV